MDVNCEPRTERRARTCTTCGIERPLEEFEPIETVSSRSTIDRRRTCRACVETVRRLLRDGHSLTAVQRRTGMDYKAISRERDRLGLPRRRARPVPDETLRTLARDGHSAVEIANRTRLSTSTVRHRLVQAGIVEKQPAIHPVAKATLDRIRALLEDGSGYAEAARTTGVDISTIRRHFPGMGWTPEDYAVHAALRRALERDPEMRRLKDEIDRAA